MNDASGGAAQSAWGRYRAAAVLVSTAALVLPLSGCVGGAQRDEGAAAPSSTRTAVAAAGQPEPNASRRLTVPSRRPGELSRIIIRSSEDSRGKAVTIPGGSGKTYIDVSCVGSPESEEIGYSITSARSTRPITSSSGIPCNGSVISDTALDATTHSTSVDLHVTGDISAHTQLYVILTKNAP